MRVVESLRVSLKDGKLAVAARPPCFGDNWLRAVTDNIVSGDMLVYVGDFNCGEGTSAINVLSAQFTRVAKGNYMGGIDIIFTNGVEASSSARRSARWRPM